MNNRFGSDVTENTDTESIAMADDDTFVSSELLRSMVDAWYFSSRDDVSTRTMAGVQGDGRIVSRDMGYIFPCNKFSGWVLQQDCWRNMFGLVNDDTSIRGKNYNLVISKSIVLSKEHLYSYQNDKVVWEFTGPQGGHHGCEDIVLNAVVRNKTHRDPILIPIRSRAGTRNGKLPPLSGGPRKNLDEGGGLSSGDLRSKFKWHELRSECVRWTADHFGDDVWELQR